MRKTIFEQIKESITFATEIKRLDTLIRDKNGIRLEAPKEPFIVFDDEVSFISLENFFDTFMFMTWKARGTCISCDDMRKTLHLDDILASEDPSFEETITYCEYVGNLIKLYDKAGLREGVHVYRTIVTEAIADNLNYILGWLNQKMAFFKNEQRVLITENDATVSAVAENVDEKLAYQIVKYNHNTLKGDIARKKKYF